MALLTPNARWRDCQRAFRRAEWRGLEFTEFDEPYAGDGFDLAESFDGGGGEGGVGDVDLDDGEGLTLRNILRASRTAEGEVGDVDAVVAEDGADAADNARDVLVADDDEGAGELGFDVDAVVVEQARRMAVEDGGEAGPVTLCVGAGDAFAGPVQLETESGAGAAGDVLAFVFLNADAALGGCRGGVDAIDAVGSVEDAGDGGVADEVGLERCETAVVGDGDVLDAAGHSLLVVGASTCGVTEELAETVCHFDVRGDLCVLLLRERREVDGVLDYAELEVVADLVGELDADGLLGLVGGSGDVGREQDVVEVSGRRSL